MTELLTAAQMKAIENDAINAGEVTGLELMERAGLAVVDAVFEEWSQFSQGKHRAVILCGPGNNGGDGFVVARLLKDRGWEVQVFLYGKSKDLPQNALENYDRWARDAPVCDWDECDIEKAIGDGPDLCVDAVFGTGLTRPLRAEDMHEVKDALIHRVFIDDGPSVAIDVPSGLCTDTGNDLGGAFPSLLTVTFHKPKIGHFLGQGPNLCGRLVTKDIGLGNRWMKAAPQLVSPSAFSPGRLGKQRMDHKYTHGHALILSGGVGKGGAARLAARGALRIGAGLASIGCPREALQENASQLNAIMLREIDDAASLREVLGDDRINALCIGPGLGLDAHARSLVHASFADKGRKVVFDADALTILSRTENAFEKLGEDHILTPHAGEFSRLFPDIAEKLKASENGPQYSKLDATKDAASRAGCVVLFKGPNTVIATPNGKCAINSAQYERSAPWLATAGSGDVLAGFIAGLLARGFPPFLAAETAAWLHLECAIEFGPGLIAEDIPETLPRVIGRLLD